MLTERSTRHTTRRGLTLPELLIASSIVAMMIATLGALAVSVQSGNEFSQGRSIATQHARVATERIQRNLNNAHASSEFPGFVAFREVIGTYSYPDTVVIWRPGTTPVNPNGLPLLSEVVIYCTNPGDASQLLEITIPANSTSVPSLDDSSGWATLLSFAKTGDGPERTVVTDLLRTASVSDGTGGNYVRGAIRFDVVLRPTDAQIQQYIDGSIAWNEIDWVQGVYSETTGLRQSWCNVELQLMPANWSPADDPDGESAIPYFTSGAAYYEVSQ